MKRLYTADDIEIGDGKLLGTDGKEHYETAETLPHEEDDHDSSAHYVFKYISYSILILTLLAASYFLYEVKIVLDDPNVPNNVYFLNENLGGTNYKNLEKLISGIALKISQRPLYLKACGQQFVVIPSTDLDFKINPRAIADGVTRVGNEGNIFQRIKYRLRLRTGRDRAYVPCKFFYNRTKLESLSSAISEFLNVSPKSSTVVEMEGGIRKITRETPGARIAPEEVARQIHNLLSAFESQNLGCANLSYEEVRPSITVADKLKQLNSTDLLSSFETSFLADNSSIRENAERAARAIDGIILKPLEVFSFNKTVGPMKYKNESDAKIFNSRQIGYFPDISGGIGVFSSGLYNSVLGTSIEVLERYNHTSVDPDSAYCPVGRDAQIIYGSKDLKFMVPKNSGPVIIFSEVNLNRLKFSIYGANKLNESVAVETREVNLVKPAEKRVKDYSMKKGEEKIESEGIPGCEVKTVKIVSVGGVENYRTVISTDMYSSLPRVIRVGDEAEE